MNNKRTGRNRTTMQPTISTGVAIVARDESDISHLLPKAPVGAIETPVVEVSAIDKAFISKYGFPLSGAPVVIQRIADRLDRYEAAMGPLVTIHDPREGADHQLQLFNTFMRALGESGDNLFMAVDLILARMYMGKDGVYSSRLVYRFIKGIKRDEGEVNSYLKILEIFLLLADPAQRVTHAGSGKIRAAVSIIDPRYRDAAFALVTYLSQYQS